MKRTILAWLILIWNIFVAWFFAVLPFPFNIGLLAWQCFLTLVVSWFMLLKNMSKR